MNNFMIGLWWLLRAGLFLFLVFCVATVAPLLIPLLALIAFIWAIGWLVREDRRSKP